MRIAQLAPLAESVPPHHYGGTELIVNLLTEGLVRRGHEVTLFASGDSVTQAKLVSVTESALRENVAEPVRHWQAYDLRLLLELERRQNEFDIVHNHMGYQALPFLQRLRCNTVTTNHNPVKKYCADIYLAYKNLPFVAISNAYRQLNYPNELNYIATIYNGIDIDHYPLYSQTKRDYLLFLGRICQDKGTLEAIEIAKALGIPLKIAGKVDQADRLYFAEKIKPWLGTTDVKYLGEVDFNNKLELYSHAIALLDPVTFDEPFGLVVAEALATGTPVLAFDRGAVKEIITDKETGIIAKTKEELIARFKEIEKISRQTCRERIVKYFSSANMITNYEILYKKLCP